MVAATVVFIYGYAIYGVPFSTGTLGNFGCSRKWLEEEYEKR